MADDLTVTSTPKNKVLAATGGAAFGGAISVVTIWVLKSLLSLKNITLPDDVESACTTIVTVLTTFIAGYQTPPGANEGVVVATDGSIKSAKR